jgi:hypothetical protein
MTEIRHVTADVDADAAERFEVYRLCECAACSGVGKIDRAENVTQGDQVYTVFGAKRCDDCRGEGRVRELVATATDAQSLGVALVTLGREGEWEGCPIGILDTQGETGQKWIVRPWLPSARNVSDAGRTLANSKKEKTT